VELITRVSLGQPLEAGVSVSGGVTLPDVCEMTFMCFYKTVMCFPITFTRREWCFQTLMSLNRRETRLL